MTKHFLDFPTPHCHVNSLDTGTVIEQFAKRELDLGTGFLTATDHGYLGACRDVYRIAKENKLNPILGIEAYHRDDNCEILQKHGFNKDEDGTYKSIYKYGHITIHALDQLAYDFLVKKVSDADLTAEQHGSERKPIFSWKDLEEIGAQNVTYTTGCLIGIIGRHVIDGRIDVAVDYYNKLRSFIKPENFYVELFTHKCDKNWVSGVFLTLEGGEVKKYYMGKKVRTEEFEEISVADLAKVVSKGKNVGKLIAIKNRNTWDAVEPKQILNCKIVQDFIQNECTPWAPDGDIQKGLNKFLMELAKRNGDKVIISDDAHYAYPEEKVFQEAKLGGMGDSFRFYGNYHRHTSDEAFAHFQETMGMDEKTFSGILENNQAWANKFKGFELKYEPSLPKSFYPSDTVKHLYKLIEERGRMDWSDKEQVARLETEIKLLHDNGTLDLLPYFFLSEEGIHVHEMAKVLSGPGRGSAAGVFISYLLCITHVPPLKHKLSLDRFITPDRIASGKLPDIDQDLPNRDVLYPWLESRFKGHYAQISTAQLLHLKSSIKDVARHLLGSVPEEMEKLCKSIPNTPQGIEDKDFIEGYTGEDGKEVKGLLEVHQGLREYTQKYPDHWKLINGLLKIKRGSGRHASGVIVADKPLDTFIPLMTIGGVRCTQYTAKSCEEVGGIKMDYLSLNTLIDIQEAIRIIHERKNIKFDTDYITINKKKVPTFRVIPYKGQFYDIWDLPEDQQVFNSIAQAETETVFQLNTSSAKKWLGEFNYWKDASRTTKLITSIDDISAFTALDRPGPLDAIITNGQTSRNMLQEYAARQRGEDALDPIEFMVKELPETNGVMVYQEQLQNIYQKLTGCDGIKANKFREDISKKRMEKVLDRYPLFMKEASDRVGREDAQKIWDQIFTFGQYGFNLAHAVSYSYIAYACAFLKYHFLLEWWAGVLRNASKEDLTEKFWKYCGSFVSMPDIQKSKATFTINNDTNIIVAPLSILKGVGEKAHDELVANRPYSSIQDLCDKIAGTKASKVKLLDNGKIQAGRSSLNRGIISKLIVSGVADSLFEIEKDPISKLESFEAALATSLKKKRPEKIKEEYRNLSPLRVYQHKKSILPILSENVVQYFHGVHGVNKTIKKIAGEPTEVYTYEPKDPEIVDFIKKATNKPSIIEKLAFVDGELFKYMNEDVTIDDMHPLHVAVGAYVMDTRQFQYRDKKAERMRSAMEIILDINGEIFKSVKWENRKTNELVLPEGNLNGAIVIALLSRWNNNYGFQFEAVIKVAEPIEGQK